MTEDLQPYINAVLRSLTVYWMIWALVGAAILLRLLWPLRKAIKFLVLRIWYDLFYISLLSRDSRVDPASGWYRSERRLCAGFYQFVPHAVSPETYVRATSYLSKARELGRRSFPLSGWLAIFVLLVAESLSFGILLAGYAAQTATLWMQSWLGYLMATVLAIVLLYITHKTGQELYLNSLRGKARQWYENKPAKEADRVLEPHRNISLETDSQDDREPIYIQLASRIEGGKQSRYRPSHTFQITTILIVVMLAVASFAIRSKVYNQIQISHVTTERAAQEPDTNSNDINILLGRQTGAADELARKQQEDAKLQAALTAFGALTVLFISLQILGISTGYFFGFAGFESAQAAGIRRDFATLNDFLAYNATRWDFYVSEIQSRLERLQGKILGEATKDAADKSIKERSFHAYIDERIARRQQSPAVNVRAVQAATLQAATATLQAATVQAATFVDPAPAGSAADATAPQFEDDAARDQRMTEEIRAKLQVEVEARERARREALRRREIEARERARLGLEKE